MGGFLIRLLLVCLGAAVFILILLPKAVFVIRISEGKIHVKKGRVPKGFISDCELLACENNVTHLTIRGTRKRGIITLKFSGRIPDSLQQRFRNVWKQYN